VAGLGLLVTISLALLLALLLECFLLLVLQLLELVCSATFSQDIFSPRNGVKKWFVEYRIALLAHVCLGHIIFIDGDSNTDIVLPDATLITCNPWLVVVVTSLNSTTNAADDFNFFFHGSLLRSFGGLLLRLGRLVEEIEALRMLSFRRSDGSSRFI
jgi:hypothetical protein